MPATQDAYARAFAANAAKKAGTPAAPSAPVPLPAPAPATGAQPPQYNMNDPSRFVSVQSPPSSGIHMGGQAIPPGVAAITQALMRQSLPGQARYVGGSGNATDANGNPINPNTPQLPSVPSAAVRAAHGGNQGVGLNMQNMTGPNALPTTPIDLFGMLGIQKPTNPQLPSNPFGQGSPAPAPGPAPAPVAPPQPPADWARQFFGSGMGSPSYGPGNAMAKLNGWAQQNPQGVQRWADAGHVPVPTMMPQQRRTGAAGR